MILKELAKNEGNSEDFNKWILAAESGSTDRFADETNHLLVGNLLQMRRHANMGVRLATMRRRLTTDKKRRRFAT